MRATRLLVGLLGLLLMPWGLIAGSAPADALAAKHKATETWTYKMEVVGQVQATQSGGVAHYYCAVGVFVPFNDAPGYDVTKADLVIGGVATTVPVGDPPYDDNASTGGLDFKPYVGQHHVLVGGWHEINGDATVLQQCEQLRMAWDTATSDTTTVTYEAVGACKKAISKEAKAAAAVQKAKKKVKNAHGPALAAAQAALRRARAALEVAQEKVNRSCTTVG